VIRIASTFWRVLALTSTGSMASVLDGVFRRIPE
jgi:hypothetical protein